MVKSVCPMGNNYEYFDFLPPPKITIKIIKKTMKINIQNNQDSSSTIPLKNPSSPFIRLAMPFPIPATKLKMKAIISHVVNNEGSLFSLLDIVIILIPFLSEIS